MKQPYKVLFEKEYTTAGELKKVAKHYKIKLNAICYKNQLEYLIPDSGCYIINMADSGNPGTHWVGLVNFIINNKPESFYYDSFGMLAPKNIIDFAKRWGDLHITRGTEIQQDLNYGYCGAYVMLFLIYMSHPDTINPKERLKDFNKLFIDRRRQYKIDFKNL